MPSPELERLLKMLRARKRDGEIPLDQFRSEFEQFSELFPIPPDVRVAPTWLGGVPVEWVTAAGSSVRQTLIFLHGGGYVSGSLNTHRELTGRLAQACGGRVVAVDYRRAPEHPFPAALDDARAVYQGLLAAGWTGPQLAVAGDSAGAGLALALLLSLREEGQPLPAAALCLSPWVDLAATGESLRTCAHLDPILQPRLLERVGAAYLRDTDPRHPFVSPLYGDLRGLPPLLIQVGSLEILLDDGRRLARQAERQGLEVELEVWEGLFHGWQQFASMLPEGQQAIENLGRFLRRIWQPAASASEVAALAP